MLYPNPVAYLLRVATLGTEVKKEAITKVIFVKLKANEKMLLTTIVRLRFFNHSGAL
ncbi:hypothetical protein [Enterococcus durans]|uniref:hypothetical protein n=1 Tax=Enterococcus durans TaxID=53345 RepID=UPI001D0AC3ED|nr:hypothetical protein [Enterococcus durans]MCB8516381.1 hypothetical protein [Enterococcus durans]